MSGNSEQIVSRLKGFRNLTPSQRRDRIIAATGLSNEDAALLSSPGSLPIETADGMVFAILGHPSKLLSKEHQHAIFPDFQGRYAQ